MNDVYYISEKSSQKNTHETADKSSDVLSAFSFFKKQHVKSGTDHFSQTVSYLQQLFSSIFLSV